MFNDDDSLAPALEEISSDNLKVIFEAERFKGAPIADTLVSIEGACTIGWADREKLVLELQQVVEKYKI